MSELSDKVRGISQLPLFPLPVVLFPSTPLPLHIFEPRYRQMIRDIQITNKLFGLSYFDASESDSNRPDVGSYGCVAELRDVQQLEDGRSNILVIGVARYRLDAYVESGEPYLVGEVSFFEDEQEDPELLEPRGRAVKELFLRVAKAARELASESAEAPDFPEVAPEQLSYLIASAVDFDVSSKYEMLKMRSTSERLKQLYNLLSQAVSQVEERANISKIAKTNGHGRKNINLS